MSNQDENKFVKSERFVVNMPDKDIANIESIARENACTMSWIYRAILFALEKKFKRGLPEDLEISRPVKFNVHFRQATICMYGDKVKWMLLSRTWQVELGPLLRFGLSLYYNGKLDLDLESLETVKEVKILKIGNMRRKKSKRGSRRYIYQNQMVAICYTKKEFRLKNPVLNIFLMEWGLANRIYPLCLD